MILAPTALPLLKHAPAPAPRGELPAPEATPHHTDGFFPSLPLLDRRTFFKGSLMGAAVVWTTAIVRPVRAASISAAGYSVLTDNEVVIANAIGNALFPPGGAISVTGEEAGVALFVDRYIHVAEPEMARLLRMLLRIIEYGPLLFAEHASRLSRLSQEDATRHLDGWATSSLYFRRALMTTVKLIFGMGYFDHPEVRRQIGWYNVCPEGRMP